jgi:hypothetical protein
VSTLVAAGQNENTFSFQCATRIPRCPTHDPPAAAPDGTVAPRYHPVMGWNLSLVHAQGPAADVEGFALAAAYQPDPTGPPTTFEAVVSDPAAQSDLRGPVAVAELPVGLVVAARLILGHTWGAQLSADGGTATWAVWQSASSSYGFAHYRGGELVREIHRSELATVHQHGDPRPQEAGLRWDGHRTVGVDLDDEQDLFDLVGAVTGLPDLTRWLDAPARRHLPTSVDEPLPEKKKRRWFGR